MAIGDSELLLFIGGYADGKTRFIEKGRTHCTIPEPFDYKTLTLISDMPTNRLYGTHEYTKQRLTAGDTIYHVMVHLDPSEDCISALIKGYKKGE